jgi:hypothetical protein
MRSGDYDLYKVQLHIVAWYDYKEKHNDANLTNLEYRRILKDFCDLVMEEVFTNIDGFEIPNKFGTLMMIGLPPKSKLTKYEKQILKLVRTENYVYSLRWLRNNYRCKVKNIYYFTFSTGKLIRKKIYACILKDRFFNWLRLDQYHLISRLEDFEINKGISEDNYKRKKGQGLLKQQIKNNGTNKKDNHIET